MATQNFGVGLSVALNKTLTCSNTLTFTGTDASSIAFGAGGTVAYTNVATLSSLVSVGTITTGTWSAAISAATSFTTAAGANATICNSSDGQVVIGSSSNGLIELGKTSMTADRTPFIDFHSKGSSNVDYDCRILASGGTVNTAGLGTLSIYGAAVDFKSNAIVGVENTTASTSATTGALVVDGGIGVAGNCFFGGDQIFATGKAMKTNTTAGNTMLLSAYDTNGAAYTSFITLTAGTTPTCAIAGATITGGTIENTPIGQTTRAAGDFNPLRVKGSLATDLLYIQAQGANNVLQSVYRQNELNTTDATNTVFFTKATTTDSLISITYEIVGKATSTQDAIKYRGSALFRNIAGVLTNLNHTVDFIYEDASLSTASSNAIISGTNARIRVSGVTGINIYWRATFIWEECIL